MFEQLEPSLARYRELEKLMADPDVFADPGRYSQLAREHGTLAKTALRYAQYKQLTEQIAEAEGLLADEQDPDMVTYMREEMAGLRKELDKITEQLQDRLLGGEDADRSLILEIRPGTGGDEAALFARDLFEMYKHYIEDRGWKLETINATVTDLGGFKEVIFGVSGEDAFGRLQFESGGHRVQRVPETETQGRIHTSAATVAVLPEPREVEIDIRDEDLRIDTMRASGPGGQSVNKTSSAVRITHEPTGTVVICQDEKSQHKNRAKAMRVLKSRIYDAERSKAHAERVELRRSLVGSGDRSQRIRTYNFPQNRVSDHRINLNLYSLDSIMAGRMDELLDGLVAHDRAERLAAAASAPSNP